MTKRGASGCKWVFAFLSPTFAFVAFMLMAAAFPQTEVPGGSLVIALGTALLISAWVCISQILRSERPALQKGILTFATIAGLAVQTIADTFLLGWLAMELWGFHGPS